MAVDEVGQGQHAAEFPDPEFGAAGEGEPVGEADPFLFGAALAPDVETPAAEGPVEGVREVPDAVQDDVTDEGGGVESKLGQAEEGDQNDGQVEEQGVGEEDGGLCSGGRSMPKREVCR